MRIVFVTQDDPFYIARFFRALLASSDRIIDPQCAVICRTMGKSPRKLARQLYEFYGPIDAARMALRFGATKFLAASIGSVSSSWPISLIQVFAKHGIETIRCRNVNSKSLLEQLRRKNPELIVSVAAPQIFKKPLLELAPLGCLNIHTARLPQYRGMMPNFWVMYNDEKRSAITVHTMNSEFDCGEIILQREFEIRSGESLDQLIKRTKLLGAECLLEALSRIAEHGIVGSDPPEVEPSYFSFPTTEDVRRFRAQGKRLL